MARFVLLPGQPHDTIGVPPLIEGIAFGTLLGDRAFDADWLRAELNTRGAVAVIPPKTNRKGHFDFDRHAYRWRHLIENFFAKLKEFRAIATHEAKVDKGVEDTFPASDPVQRAGATGFIAPDGTDTAVHGNLAEQAPAGTAEALGQAGQVGGAAIAAVNRYPLPALLIAGTVGFVFGLVVNGRR